MDAKRVLVIEDDEATAAFLTDNLAADGFAVWAAAAVPEGVRAIEVRRPDVVLLDIGLGDANGLAVLDTVRGADGLNARVDRNLPVIVLSGRGSEVERLRGFKRGADDYLVKPFSYPELVARMQAVLRRTEPRGQMGVVRVADLELDPVARTVALGGQPVHLSMREFDLLHVLAREPARVWTKGELMKDVWGYAVPGASRTVDTHACRIRNKLAGGRVPFVHTVRGVGYRLVAVSG